jgi:hypothetical protein
MPVIVQDFVLNSKRMANGDIQIGISEKVR